MKRNFLLILLAVMLCFTLAACNGAPSEEGESPRLDLTDMTDEQVMDTLLEQYASYQEPAVFSATMSWSYRSGDSVVASMEGTVRSNGPDRVLASVRTVDGTSVRADAVYSGGTLYVNQGEKVQCSLESKDAIDYFASFYPIFGTAQSFDFAQRDLLPSDDGTYALVLSRPQNGMGDSDILTPLTAVGNQEAPVTLSNFSDVYLTLRFAADGSLVGQTLGFDCHMTADGVVTEGTVLFKFTIVSTDPVQTPISAPEDKASYSVVDSLDKPSQEEDQQPNTDTENE